MKCPYTYPHKSRRAKADYLCGIGGYSRYQDGTYPLEFDVSAYRADFGFDHLWEKYAAEHWPFDEKKVTPDTVKTYYDLAMRLYKEHEQHLWAWGVEDACRALHDTDVYSMLWDGTRLEVTLELHGRCGKHLLITEFEGHTLEGMSTDDLYHELMGQGNGCFSTGIQHDSDTLKKGCVWEFWTNEDLNKLYKYVRQCEVDFTVEKASAEVEYLGAFSFFCNIVNPEWESVKDAMAAHEDVVEAAKLLKETMISGGDMLDISAVDEAFDTLCAAAGVAPEELE